jgi:hypothetical protein
MTEQDASELQQALEGIEEVVNNHSQTIHLWDQQPGEPDSYYADFLIYLALGRGRTIPAAWRAKQEQKQLSATSSNFGTKKEFVFTQASGAFWSMQSKWNWMERAAKHDVYELSQLVPQTVADIFKAIGAFARVTREALEDGSVRPQNWQEARSGVETIASYISPDIIQATVDHSGDASGNSASESSQAIIDG